MASPGGVQATFSVGMATASGIAVASPAGVSATFAVGTPSATGAALASPVGVQAVFSVGAAIATGETGSADATAFPFGVAMAASVGQVTATGDVVSVIGGGGWGHGHQPFHQPFADAPSVVDATAYPMGVQAQAGVGTAIASGTATARPDGVAMAADVGTGTAAVDVTAQPAGVELVAAVGTAQAFEVFVMAVQPYAPVRIDAVAIPPLGVSAQAVVGQATGRTDAVDRAWLDLQHAHQADEDELLLLGVFDV